MGRDMVLNEVLVQLDQVTHAHHSHPLTKLMLS